MKLVIDDDKDVSSLRVDTVCRNTSDGMNELLKGEHSTVYIDHYLDGPFIGLNLIVSALDKLDKDKYPEKIYFISSNKYQNKNNADTVIEIFPCYQRERVELFELGNISVSAVPIQLKDYLTLFDSGELNTQQEFEDSLNNELN